MDGVFLSIIVTAYNHSEYIRKALDSIFMQEVTYSYEVLIGDDASSDGTQDIVSDYEKKYPSKVKLFIRKENIGASENTFRLIMESQGKYLAMLEGDDYWTDSSKLQKQIDYLEANPDSIGVCHRFITVDNDGIPIKRKLGWVKHKKTFAIDDFQGIYMPSQLSTFVYVNIFKNSGCDFSFLYLIDRDISDRSLTLLLLSKGNFHCMGETMGAYRVSSSSSISQGRYKNNTNEIEQELALTRKLENLSKDELGIIPDFTHHRKNLYTTALVRGIRLLKREYFKMLCEIREHRSRVVFLVCAIGLMFKRIIKRVFAF